MFPLLAGCCAQPRSPSPPAPVRPAVLAPPRPTVIEPSPILQLIREERLAMLAMWDAIRRPVAQRTEVLEPAEDDESEQPENDEDEDEETGSAEGEVRKVIVQPRGRLATTEDLIRAAIRDAESRRPREFFETRFLLRKAGPIRVCGDEASEVRRAVTRWIRAARSDLKACFVAALAEEPSVIVKAPASLVLEQAKARGDIVFSLEPRLSLGPDGARVTDWGWKRGVVGAKTEACLAQVLDQTWDTGVGIQRTCEAEVPLVAFVQSGHGGNLGNTKHMLAFQASVMGWLHYERHEYPEALEYFRDAYWSFQLAEFKYLVGMGLEALGDGPGAARAYATYLEARPHAPEKTVLAARIVQLERRR